MELLDTVKDILVGTFKVPAEGLTADTTFDALGLDSLDLVELTLVVEERTGMKIGDDEVEKILTVGDAVALLETKAGASA